MFRRFVLIVLIGMVVGVGFGSCGGFASANTLHCKAVLEYVCVRSVYHTPNPFHAMLCNTKADAYACSSWHSCSPLHLCAGVRLPGRIGVFVDKYESQYILYILVDMLGRPCVIALW